MLAGHGADGPPPRRLLSHKNARSPALTSVASTVAAAGKCSRALQRRWRSRASDSTEREAQHTTQAVNCSTPASSGKREARGAL